MGKIVVVVGRNLNFRKITILTIFDQFSYFLIKIMLINRFHTVGPPWGVTVPHIWVRSSRSYKCILRRNKSPRFGKAKHLSLCTPL